jgi:hypothetical protein
MNEKYIDIPPCPVCGSPIHLDVTFEYPKSGMLVECRKCEKRQDLYGFRCLSDPKPMRYVSKPVVWQYYPVPAMRADLI